MRSAFPRSIRFRDISYGQKRTRRPGTITSSSRSRSRGLALRIDRVHLADAAAPHGRLVQNQRGKARTIPESALNRPLLPTPWWLRFALDPCISKCPTVRLSARRAFERQCNTRQRVKNHRFCIQASRHGSPGLGAMDQNSWHADAPFPAGISADHPLEEAAQEYKRPRRGGFGVRRHRRLNRIVKLAGPAFLVTAGPAQGAHQISKKVPPATCRWRPKVWGRACRPA